MEKIILPLHLIVLSFIAWNIVLADHIGFSWIRGKVKILQRSEVKKYHYRILVGLALMICTGFLLFLNYSEFLLTRPQFYVKMSLVGALVVNSFVVSYLQETAITRSFDSLTFKEKLPLLISGAISTVCWLLTIAAGFYLIPE